MATFSRLLRRNKSSQKANDTELMETITTPRIVDVVFRFGCSLSYYSI